MREPFRLTFRLPPVILVPEGRHQPCLHGCLLRIKPGRIAEIEGPSREQVFAQANRFLRLHLKDRPPLSIAATLSTPALDRFDRPYSRRDGWQIIAGATIAFSPTSMPPHIPTTELPTSEPQEV